MTEYPAASAWTAGRWRSKRAGGGVKAPPQCVSGLAERSLLFEFEMFGDACERLIALLLQSGECCRVIEAPR